MNVAEKPSVANTVVGILSKKQFEKLPSLSKFNPVYEFDYPIKGIDYTMNFTSIRGHLMNWEFTNDRKKWGKINTIHQLFESNEYK